MIQEAAGVQNIKASADVVPWGFFSVMLQYVREEMAEALMLRLDRKLSEKDISLRTND